MEEITHKNKKILPRFLIALLNLIIILGLFAGGWWFYKKELKNIFLEKGLPTLSEIEKKIIAPEPLSGPERETKAEILEPSRILVWTNFYRKENDAAEFRENELLKEAAKAKIEDMFQKQYFEHVSPNGENAGFWVEKEGYRYLVIGENLALGDYRDEKELTDAWMASLGHRENILNPKFTEIGIAALLGDFKERRTFLAVQIFGAPASLCPSPDQNLKNAIDDKKARYETLQQIAEKIKTLVNEGNALMALGNKKIRQGNQEKDKKDAEKLWQEGEALQKEAQEKYEQARRLQEELESADELSKEIKILIEEHNIQVNRYNTCVQKYAQ